MKKQVSLVSSLAAVLMVTVSFANVSQAADGTTQDIDSLYPNMISRIRPQSGLCLQGDTEGVCASAVAATAGSADGAPQSGESVYNSVCQACHSAGIAGAPKTGDKAAWSSRIGQGSDTLYKHAIEGFTGAAGVMPAKGGNAALSDDEVKGAVDYLVKQAS